MPKRLFLFVMSLLLATSYWLLATGSVGADELEDISKQIGELTRARELSEAATRPLEAELGRLEVKLTSIEGQILQAAEDLNVLEGSISSREEDLSNQYALLALRVRNFYKRSTFLSPFLIFLSSASAADLTRELASRQATADQDKQVIVEITTELIVLEADKQKVEEDRKTLALLQGQVDTEAAFFRKEVKGAKDYQEELAGQIADLTVRQQQILSEKAGTFQSSVGDVPLSDDPASRPDYNPGFSPAFAVFSFGAPHFKGMSQYGAFGRAKSGQSTDDILRAYYGDVRIEDPGGMPETITTSEGVKNFEDDYLRGIAEMPSKWAEEGGMEALKAQAIAARSYALAYTGWRMGDKTASGSICTTEACQVYRASKLGDAKWAEAVNATRGKILVGNGSNEVVNAWYASTSGGYQESYSSLSHSTPAFWDTPSGRSGWTSEAWEKVGDSPWFYKGWYKSRSGDSCGRSHPWLTAEEMADVLNAWVVLIKHGQGDDRVTPSGSCWGGDPYSVGELRSKAASLSTGYASVTGVNVTYSDSGVTANVTFSTDKGPETINGLDFKKAFNLRAPGRIALKSGLFNIERK